MLAKSPALPEPGSYDVQGWAGSRARALPSGFCPGYFVPPKFSDTLNEVHLGGSVQVPFHPENLRWVSSRITGEASGTLFIALGAGGCLRKPWTCGKEALLHCVLKFSRFKTTWKIGPPKGVCNKETKTPPGGIGLSYSQHLCKKAFSEPEPYLHLQFKWLPKKESHGISWNLIQSDTYFPKLIAITMSFRSGWC